MLDPLDGIVVRDSFFPVPPAHSHHLEEVEEGKADQYLVVPPHGLLPPAIELAAKDGCIGEALLQEKLILPHKHFHLIAGFLEHTQRVIPLLDTLLNILKQPNDGGAPGNIHGRRLPHLVSQALQKLDSMNRPIFIALDQLRWRLEVRAAQNFCDQAEEPYQVPHGPRVIQIPHLDRDLKSPFLVKFLPLCWLFLDLLREQITQPGQLHDVSPFKQAGGEPEHAQLADKDIAVKSREELGPEGPPRVVLIKLWGESSCALASLPHYSLRFLQSGNFSFFFHNFAITLHFQFNNGNLFRPGLII